jgi:putative transposase
MATTSHTENGLRIINLFGAFICRLLDVCISPNSLYDSIDILEAVLFTASQEKSVEECAARMRDLSGDKTPSADTVMRRLGKLSKGQLFEMFDAFVAHSIAKARRKGLLKSPVLLAIDCHDEAYYGKLRPPEVKGTKKCKGTNYAYQYIVLDIVVEGQRFTIGILPVPSLVDANSLVKVLLKKVMPLIDIEAVLLDRGFYSVAVICDIIELGLVFEMPAPRNEKVKCYLALQRGFRFSIDPYTVESKPRSVTVTIVMAQSPRKVRELPDKDPLFVFFTNGSISEELIQEKIENYDYRWGIETGFRVRDDFLIQTTTRNPVIRYFFFVLAAMLYDHWLLVNVLVGWTPNPHYDYAILAREYRWWIECYTALRHQTGR